MSDPNRHASDETTGTHRREFLKYAGATLALLVSPVGHAAERSILAVRVWPSDDYTRITLEGKAPFKYSSMIVKNPERLVIDLEGVEFNSVIRSLPDKILDSDPYIKLIRAGRNRPGVVRIVVELKTEVKPQIFTLDPVGRYGDRLVVDLYPPAPRDPLLALLDQSNKAGPQEAKLDRDYAHQPAEDRVFTIALDPGHGGEDPGAIGHRGTYEKHITIEVAQRLKKKIDALPNMRAMLTRDADYFVPLHQRVVKARKVRADLFVSIHADAFIKPQARGSSVFILSERGATNAAARWLAKSQNDADLIGGVNISTKDGHLAQTLLDLSQTATLNDSMRVGKAVLSQLGDINQLHSDDVEQAGFAVLKAPDIPSILVETAFISNPEEERHLRTSAYQEKLADAILKGIQNYFADSPAPSPRTRVARLDG